MNGAEVGRCSLSRTVLDIRTDNRKLVVRSTQELGANNPSADAIVRRIKTVLNLGYYKMLWKMYKSVLIDA
ncbi:unnamed protein product [Gongylonema pulchrum]|uniref:Reverse transcriptase n=1 Tax=Gongylonema pulchrum TaxID=637853 RepID=A0A183D9P0_9BILA|nr:unnamed protein product [Gongylonema pulchrum]